MNGIKEIRLAVGLTKCAFSDARTDGSSYVARALTVIANNEEILRNQRLSRHTFDIVTEQMDRADEGLRMSGYLVTGE